MSIKLSRDGPVGTSCASLKQSCASCRYWSALSAIEAERSRWQFGSLARRLGPSSETSIRYRRCKRKVRNELRTFLSRPLVTSWCRHRHYQRRANLGCASAELVPHTSAAEMKLIISSLCGFPGHGTHLLTRGNEVRVLVRNLFVSFYACLIGKLALPNHIRVIRILRLPRTFAASQHATAGDAAFFPSPRPLCPIRWPTICSRNCASTEPKNGSRKSSAWSRRSVFSIVGTIRWRRRLRTSRARSGRNISAAAVGDRKAPRLNPHDRYFPLKRGGRFSLNDAMPSRRSSVGTVRW